jgi:hypothetical protein
MRSAVRSTSSLLAGAHPHTTTTRHTAVAITDCALTFNTKDRNLLTRREPAEAHATASRSRSSNSPRKALSPRALKLLDVPDGQITH